MRPLRTFEEFLKKGTMRRRSPDNSRARSLLEEAEKRNKFLNELSIKIELSGDNANYFIESAYDVLIELIRAKLLTDGFSSSGEGAHEAEVSYSRNLDFPEKDVRFLNDLRFFRNGILYYGKDFDAEYGRKVIYFLNRIYPILKEIVEKGIKNN